MKILTKHFQILYNNDKPVRLYEFKIPELEGKPKRKVHAMMESIVANSTILADNRTSFATYYFCTIMAWVNLRGLLGPANPDGTYHLLNIRDGQVDLRMNLRFERQLDVQDLLRFARMDPAIITGITNANAMMDDRTWDRDMNLFSRLVIGLRVYVTYDRGDEKSDPEAFARLNSLEGRIKIIAELGEPANLQMFTPQGGQAISVADHFAASR